MVCQKAVARGFSALAALAALLAVEAFAATPDRLKVHEVIRLCRIDGGLHFFPRRPGVGMCGMILQSALQILLLAFGERVRRLAGDAVPDFLNQR